LDILHLAAPCRNVPVTFTLDGIGAMLLLLPLLCVVFGGFIGYLFSRRSEREQLRSPRAAVYFGLGLLALTALVANSRQTLYELGLSVGAIDLVAGAAIAAGTAAMVGLWRRLYPARGRWLLLIPAVVLLLEPLLTTLTLAAWTLNGFAP
jgi:hypothetical protein